MAQDYVLNISELETAKNTNDRKSLEQAFNAARKTLDAGKAVRLNQEFSDAGMETIHVIDSVDKLNALEKEYLS